MNQRYAFSINGGNSTFRNRISLTYDVVQNNQVDNRSNRKGLFWSGNYLPNNILALNYSVSFNNQYVINSGEALNYSMGSAGRQILFPYASLVDNDGNPSKVFRGISDKFLDYYKNDYLKDWGYYPISNVQESRKDLFVNSFRPNIEISIKPNRYVVLKAQYGLNFQMDNSELVYGKNSYYTKNLQNIYSFKKNGIVGSIIPEGGIVSFSNEKLIEHRVRLQGDLNISTFKGHRLVGLAGIEGSDVPSTFNSNEYYGYNEDTKTITFVDYNSYFPTFQGMRGNAQIPRTGRILGQHWRSISLFSNLAYEINDRYFITLSGRKDATNIFGIATNRRWNPLWSIGLAYDVKKENFLKDLEIIDQVKLRGTWGYSGNSGGVGSGMPIIRYTQNNKLNIEPEATISQIPNDNLKWETVRMMNIGLDFKLWQGKLGGSLEYFNKKSTDLLSTQFLDPSAGMRTMVRNIGNVKGHGFDVRLDSRIILSKFSWNGAVFLSFVRDRVVTYYGFSQSPQMMIANNGRNNYPSIDYGFYPIFGYRTSGLDEHGDPVGFLEGKESKEYSKIANQPLDQAIFYGSAIPKYHGSFRNSFTYKGISLNVLLGFKFGNYFAREAADYGLLINSWRGHKEIEKRWRKPGDEKYTQVPRLGFPVDSRRDFFYKNSEANVEPGGFIRLKDVSLNLPLPISKKMNFNLVVMMSDLGLIYRQNKQGLDPEFLEVPPSPTISFGINIKPL
ncbi:TonB-dependent receptor [Sphingobacterium sp. CZ-2]|uniref:TonB-dependent receptor n=1 Tax=Sphingobacterium sp. CZ-2 TaxID=2557994 RepID=UPI00106FE665|nr:TonB-dependent receptor [Sphingobacterium sp. CZ-2]QBR13248.1 hypothetical protein E3D81_14175 [Sphingobacterium sp. CZ-2]